SHMLNKKGISQQPLQVGDREARRLQAWCFISKKTVLYGIINYIQGSFVSASISISCSLRTSLLLGIPRNYPPSFILAIVTSINDPHRLFSRRSQDHLNLTRDRSCSFFFQ